MTKTTKDRILDIVAHLIYWGLGVPVVLIIGLFEFLLAHAIISNLMAIGDFLIGCLIFFGTVILSVLLFFGAPIAWVVAGQRLGYLEKDPLL